MKDIRTIHYELQAAQGLSYPKAIKLWLRHPEGLRVRLRGGYAPLVAVLTRFWSY